MPLSEFAWHQFAIVGSFSLVSYYAHRIANYFGVVRTTLTGLFLGVLATGSLLFFASYAHIPTVALITPLMCLFAVSCAIPFAMLFAASLSVMPKKMGLPRRCSCQCAHWSVLLLYS